MKLSPGQRWRICAQKLQHTLRMHAWFPQVPLALLLGFGGAWLLQSELGTRWRPLLEAFAAGHRELAPNLLPPLLIGVGMLIMALGLLLRSRIAWIMAVLLAATAAVSLVFGQREDSRLLLAYFGLLTALLAVSWRQFDHASIAASTLFALASVAMLLQYATFGGYYLGADFRPPIEDLPTAFYSAIVTMTTVGYGDIVPATIEARLFTVSVIVLGVAVFATSLTAVIAPMVSRSLQRIVHHEEARMKRENHFVVIGSSPLAGNTCRELARRGQPVTRIVRQAPSAGGEEGFDIVVGDPGSAQVLREAGADKATAVMAMSSDDSENAFTVLATRGLGPGPRTVAAVNDAQHLERVRLVQPDVVIAPQILGGELAAMLMCGEDVPPDFVLRRVLQQGDASNGAG